MDEPMDSEMEHESNMTGSIVNKPIFKAIKINVPVRPLLPVSAPFHTAKPFKKDSMAAMLVKRRTIKKEINGEVSEAIIDSFLSASADRLAKIELMEECEREENMEVGETMEKQKESLPVANYFNSDVLQVDDDIQIVFESIIAKEKKDSNTEEKAEDKERKKKKKYLEEDRDDKERRKKSGEKKKIREKDRIRRNGKTEKHRQERKKDDKTDSDRRRINEIPTSYRSSYSGKYRNEKRSDFKKYSARRRRGDSESRDRSIVNDRNDKRREGRHSDGRRRRRYSTSSDESISIVYHGKKSDKERQTDIRSRRDSKSSNGSSSIGKHRYRGRSKEKSHSPRRRRSVSSDRSSSIVTTRSVSRTEIDRAIRSTLTPQVSTIRLIEHHQSREFQETHRHNYRSEPILIEEEEESIEEEEEIVNELFTIDRGNEYVHYDGPDQAFINPYIPQLARERFEEKNTNDFEFTFEYMKKGQKELALKRVENTDLGYPNSPLGAIYDPVLGMFIYTDTGNGNILFATYEGFKKEVMTGFKQPSAIAIIKPSSHFAVLDWHGITMVDMISNRKTIITDGFDGRYRGLATMIDGNLATILHCVSDWEPPMVVIWNSSAYNKRLVSTPVSPFPIHGLTLPSFIAAHRGMIYVTDLDRNVLSSYYYNVNGHHRSLQYVAKRNMWNGSGFKTKYMAGICVDAAHSILVADARERCIHHLASDGSLLQERIPFLDNSNPYISGIAVAPQGRLIVCFRRGQSVALYDIVPRPSPDEGLIDKLYQLW